MIFISTHAYFFLLIRCNINWFSVCGCWHSTHCWQKKWISSTPSQFWRASWTIRPKKRWPVSFWPCTVISLRSQPIQMFRRSTALPWFNAKYWNNCPSWNNVVSMTKTSPATLNTWARNCKVLCKIWVHSTNIQLKSKADGMINHIFAINYLTINKILLWSILVWNGHQCTNRLNFGVKMLCVWMKRTTIYCVHWFTSWKYQRIHWFWPLLAMTSVNTCVITQEENS